jgi:hypothetical protein
VDRRPWHGGDSAHTRLAGGSYDEVSMIDWQFRVKRRFLPSQACTSESEIRHAELETRNSKQ